ncbi:MAG: ComEC/Rec2 family competence protein [Deltaproteobacteria bacterium]|jgi:competence protein ComEC|nr:ComEC/Rec2 family competence protein [Deltaproteobacteria bacterium]
MSAENNPCSRLLLRQILLLAALAGVCASRFFQPGLLAFLLLLLHQEERIRGLRGWLLRGLFLAAAGLAFGGGALYAELRAPSLPEFPEELRKAFDPDLAPPRGSGAEADPFRQGLRLRATVQSVQGRRDRNLRIILERARFLPEPAAFPGLVPGKILFTWHEPVTPEGRKPPPPDLPFRRGEAPRREAGAKAAAAGEENLPDGVWRERRPAPGDRLELVLRLREIRGPHNPGLPEIESYWADRGAGLRAWAEGDKPWPLFLGREAESLPARLRHTAALWREELRLGVLEALPQDGDRLRNGAELIPALLFGDQYLLDGGDAELFARSTLAHSLALSGLHLGYAAGLGSLAALLLYRLFPGLALRLPRQKGCVLAGFAPALAYLWLGSAPPSLLRAFLMLAFIGLFLCRGRPHAPGDALILAVALIVLLDPAALFDLSLQLSALCIAALVLCSPLYRAGRSRRRASSGRKFPVNLVLKGLRALLLVFLSSLAIQTALAPLLARAFGQLGLALPLNLLWLPVLGLLVMPASFLGLLAAGLHLEGAAGLLFYLASLPCDLLLRILRLLDESGLLPVFCPPRPHWLSIMAYWFILALLPSLYVRRGQGASFGGGPLLKFFCALLLLAAPCLWQQYDAARDALRLRLLDVGQGQAVLLEWKGGKRLLLDGGGSNSPRFDPGRRIVAATLADNRFPSLDYMLASHLDVDHARGLLFLLRHIPVTYYGDNGQIPDRSFSREILALLKERGLRREVFKAGDRLFLEEDLWLEFLHPAEGITSGGGNNSSLVIRLVWRGRGLALLCGDVEKSGQRSVLRRLRSSGGGDMRADIVLAPHHGSAGALLPDFYLAARPRLVLASAGYANPWNFPSLQVRAALRELGIPLLDTAACGQITVEWAGARAEPEVRTSRGGLWKE